MSRAIAKHQFHSFPRLGNMLMIKLFKIHNVVPKSDDLGGKYLEIKASLHLFQESILFLGKDENQVLARCHSENGNSFNLTISLSTYFFLLHMTQINEITKMGCDIFTWKAEE